MVGGRGKAPMCGVFCVAMRVRRRSTVGVARPPALCHRGGDGEAACERYGFSGFTLSDGVWYDSGTTAIGPAWCWPT